MTLWEKNLRGLTEDAWGGRIAELEAEDAELRDQLEAAIKTP